MSNDDDDDDDDDDDNDDDDGDDDDDDNMWCEDIEVQGKPIEIHTSHFCFLSILFIRTFLFILYFTFFQFILIFRCRRVCHQNARLSLQCKLQEHKRVLHLHMQTGIKLQ